MPSGECMDTRQDMSSDDTKNVNDEAMDSMDEPNESVSEEQSSDTTESGQSKDSLYIQKRLKKQKRSHEREIRDLQARMADMQSKMQSPTQNQSINSYGSPQADNMDDERIHKAVSYALQHRDMEERKAKDAQQMAHVHKQYGELQKHLDNAADKYDDFDEVVRGEDSPFTAHMRDAALFLPKSGSGSAAEVLYKLGKNPELLKRISELHPLDQASEMVKLSHALIGGGENKSSNTRPMGQIKSNPAINSHSVTEKTSVSDLRKRMRNGWK